MQDLWENQTPTGVKISIGQFITELQDNPFYGLVIFVPEKLAEKKEPLEMRSLALPTKRCQAQIFASI